MISVGSFQTPFPCTSVEMSPFDERRLAVATSQNKGIFGTGKIHILEIDSGAKEDKNNKLNEIVCLDNVSGINDCSWSELNQNHILTGCCDGAISLWDVNTMDGEPLCRWLEHEEEIVAVDWNIIDKDTFLVASTDGTIRLFRPEMFESVSTFYNIDVSPTSVVWSPHSPEAFATAMTDGSIRLWDTRQATHASSVVAHTEEALTVDYDKFSEFLVVSGGADRVIKTWDMRFSSAPANTLIGHSFSVKRLKCHPHIPHVVGSVSQDNRAVIWDSRPLPFLTRFDASNVGVYRDVTLNTSDATNNIEEGTKSMREGESVVNYGGRGENGSQELASFSHGEFATGIDFSLFSPDRLATCGDDRQVHVWEVPLTETLTQQKSIKA